MKEMVANISFTRKRQGKRNTTPLLVMKTPTSIRASREVAIGGATAGAGVESDDKGRNILGDASISWGNRRRGADDSRSDDGGGVWNSNVYRYVIVLGLGKSYGGDMFLRLLRGWSRMNGTSIGGSNDRSGGQ